MQLAIETTAAEGPLKVMCPKNWNMITFSVSDSIYWENEANTVKDDVNSTLAGTISSTGLLCDPLCIYMMQEPSNLYYTSVEWPPISTITRCMSVSH